MDYFARLREIANQFQQSAHRNLRYKMSRVRTIVAVNRLAHLRPVVGESLVESNLYMWCELIDHIMAIEVQPFSTTLNIDGRQTRYTPDALILTRTGEYVVECKPSREYFDKDFDDFVRAARGHFEQFGLKFVVIDEHDVGGWDLQANLCQLWRALRAPQLHDAAVSVSAHVQRAIEQGRPELATIGASLQRGYSSFAVHRALATGLIGADLHSRLARQTALLSKPIDGARGVLSKLRGVDLWDLPPPPAIDWGTVPCLPWTPTPVTPHRLESDNACRELLS